MGVILENLFLISIFIVLGAVLKKLCGQKYGARWRKILWGILALRILVPFQIPFAFSRKITVSAGLSYTGAMRTGLFPEALETNGYSNMKMGIFLHMPILVLLAVLSVIVSVCLIIRHHEQYGFAVRRLLDSMRDTGQKMGDMAVYTSSEVDSPMILGYRNSVLLLPACKFPKEDLKYVLAHENVHYRKRDLWYKRLILLANDIYWFHPLLYLMRRMAYEDVELCCDEEATKGFDEKEKAQYCEVLLKTAQNAAQENCFTARLGGGGMVLKERIASVFAQKNQKAGLAILAGLLLLLVVCEGMVQVVVANPAINGSYEIEEQTIFRLMRHIEQRMNSSGEFGDVTVQYTYNLERPAYSLEELNEHLSVRIVTSRYGELSELMRDSMRAYVSSWFGGEYENIVVVGE